uniref:Uncharacterized protein n=1 Tax=Neogobius melanostomus TaxID=47308 RepID=A0A8C6WPI5_9GOBI
CSCSSICSSSSICSAVYCSVNTGGNYRLYFGSGTRLWVQTPDDLEPSYYPLEANDEKVCLATGFTRHNKLKDNPLFKKVNGTFIDRESKEEEEGIHGRYSQVALMSTEGDEENCPESSGSSDDTLQPDPTVNLLSLTVLGLRILFIKTVAFNVLLTLRYCISR